MRILTYNIRGGLGMDGRRDTARIAAAVAAHSPDVVCFQEVHQRLPWSGLIDQPRRLRKELGLGFTFQANLSVGVGGYGLGVATEYPVLTVQKHSLPSVGEQRGALEVRLETPDGPLTVFCTHWGLKRDERERQARQMTEWVNGAPRPLVVCGDLNEAFVADYIQRLLRETGLRDADAEADRPTYPADAPRARIDAVFYSDGLRFQTLTVGDSQASDHVPLWADFDWD